MDVTKSIKNMKMMGVKKNRIRLTDQERLLLSTLALGRKNIFTLKDIMATLDCTYVNARKISNRLVKKKWIIPVTRGKYLIVPLSAGIEAKYTEHEFIIASNFVEHYYIGYWSALNFYGFTEQTPFTVFIASTKQLKRRRILDADCRFVKLNRRKFFGFEKVLISNSPVNISNKEKTIADALDHPEYCGGISEVAKCLWNSRNEISLKKVVKYSLKMGNSTILKRLGYLFELLKIEAPEKTMDSIKKGIGKGYSPLDTMGVKKGKYVSRWNLILNVSEESILDWRGGY